jgi:hypothetical protein
LIAKSGIMLPVGHQTTKKSFFWIRIGDKEITDIDVFPAFAAISFTVFLKENRALVVLKEDIILDCVALRFHKVLAYPANGPHEVVSSNYFGFSRTLGVELLLSGGYDWESTSHRQTAAGMPT